MTISTKFHATVVCLTLAVCATAGSIDEHVALGLPLLDAAHANPSTAQIALGEKLFFEPRLSADGSTSCASCHQPERAFTDGKPLAQGIGNRSGTRNTPSLWNAAFNTSQFWDGRRASLEQQALDPLINPREHGMRDHAAVIAILQSDASYASAFRTAFQIDAQSIQIEHVTQALAAFERTLIAGNSAFDRYAYADQKDALTPAAQRGLALFQGAAQCASCHTLGERHALFSDNQFHSLNVGLQRIEQKLPQLTTRLVQARQRGESLDQTILNDEDIAELGRFASTLKPADIGKFRTPSLRNVALTPPYMHDGSVATLEQAVELEIYYRSAEGGRPLILTPLEKSELVEFLKALSSPVAVKSSISPHRAEIE